MPSRRTRKTRPKEPPPRASKASVQKKIEAGIQSRLQDLIRHALAPGPPPEPTAEALWIVEPGREQLAKDMAARITQAAHAVIHDEAERNATLSRPQVPQEWPWISSVRKKDLLAQLHQIDTWPEDLDPPKKLPEAVLPLLYADALPESEPLPVIFDDRAGSVNLAQWLRRWAIATQGLDFANQLEARFAKVRADREWPSSLPGKVEGPDGKPTPGAVPIPWTQAELVVLWLAHQDVLSDRKRVEIAVDAGRPHHDLVQGMAKIRHQKEDIWGRWHRLALITRTGTSCVQLSLPTAGLQEEDDAGLTERITRALQCIRNDWRTSAEPLRHWAAFLRGLSVEGGRTGYVWWSLDDHLEALGISLQNRQRREVRQRVARLIESFTMLELAVYSEDGIERERRPLFDVARKLDRKEGEDEESFVMRRMEWRIHPLLYEGVRRPNGEVGSNYTWIPLTLPHVNHQRFPHVHTLGLVLPMRFRRAAGDQGHARLRYKGASVLRAGGIKFDQHRPSETWQVLNNTLDKLQSIEVLESYRWESDPGLDTIVEIEAAPWLRDRLLGVRPIEPKAERTLTGADLKAWRKEKKLTQKATAEKLGFSRRGIILVESKPEKPLSKRLREALQAAVKKSPPQKPDVH